MLMKCEGVLTDLKLTDCKFTDPGALYIYRGIHTNPKI